MTGEAIFEAQRVFAELHAKLDLPVGNPFAALPWSHFPWARDPARSFYGIVCAVSIC